MANTQSMVFLGYFFFKKNFRSFNFVFLVYSILSYFANHISRILYSRWRHLTLGIVITHSPHGCLEIRCRLLLDLVGQMMYFKSVESWYELICRTLWPIFWMHHKKHVWETSAKICPISVVVPRRLRSVDVHAFRAV